MNGIQLLGLIAMALICAWSVFDYRYPDRFDGGDDEWTT